MSAPFLPLSSLRLHQLVRASGAHHRRDCRRPHWNGLRHLRRWDGSHLHLRYSVRRLRSEHGHLRRSWEHYGNRRSSALRANRRNWALRGSRGIRRRKGYARSADAYPTAGVKSPGRSRQNSRERSRNSEPSGSSSCRRSLALNFHSSPHVKSDCSKGA